MSPRTRLALAACASLLLTAGCASPDNTCQAFSRDWASWREDPSGRKPSPISKDLREAVKTEERWRELWGGTAPAVDFAKEMVLVATTRIVEHPKDAPRIWRLRRTEGKPDVAVLVRVRQVGGDFVNELAGGSAYHFVVVPREEVPLHWRDMRVVYDADGDVDQLEMVKDYDE